MKCILVMGLFFSFRAESQCLSKDVLVNYQSWSRYKEIDQFYALNQGIPIWLKNSSLQKEFLATVQQSSAVGLNEADYQSAYFQRYRVGQGLSTLKDSFDMEIRFTDAAIHFFSDLKWGNHPPSFSFTGNRYAPDLSALLEDLQQHLKEGNLSFLPPGTAEFH